MHHVNLYEAKNAIVLKQHMVARSRGRVDARERNFSPRSSFKAYHECRCTLCSDKLLSRGHCGRRGLSPLWLAKERAGLKRPFPRVGAFVAQGLHPAMTSAALPAAQERAALGRRRLKSPAWVSPRACPLPASCPTGGRGVKLTAGGSGTLRTRSST